VCARGVVYGTARNCQKVISLDLNKEEVALYRRYQVGMILKSFNLISSCTAVENVAFPLLFAGVAKKERKRQAEQLVQRVGLYDRKDHRPAELSGFQREL
jgi:putative ABC transport system ATP-binding protein